MTEHRWIQKALVCGLLAGCAAGNDRSGSRNEEDPTGNSQTNRSSGGNSEHPGMDPELRALVTEALTPQLCPKLTNSFIGLPGDGPALRGPASGTLPTAGRWWIRRCNARVVGDRLELAIGGPGWTWVDRETSGFRVRQYMLFEADAELGADVSVGYDRNTRVASLWMRPGRGVTARVTPRGVVSAEPTGIFAAMIGGILPITGASASDRARAQVEEIGSTQMRERLSAGFTMTVQLDRRQTDFMVGSLERGEVPQRPYPDDPAVGAWQINQRATVYPGGLDVIGPLDLSSTQALDIVLEEGEGAVLRSVCADPMNQYLLRRFDHPGDTTAPPAGTPVAELNNLNAPRRIELPQATCPTLLLLTPRANAALPIRVKMRVAPVVTAAVARPTRFRVQLIGGQVRPQNSGGHDWDVVGGEADLYVTIASVPRGRQIDRSPTISDRNAPVWNRWLPGVFDANQDFPLRFTVSDEDSTSDELVGSADLDAHTLPTTAGEITIPIRTSDAVPVQMGTLRLRLEPQ